MRRVVVVTALLAAASCAYYNGLYNANDLAHRAEKAERDGRTFDAQSLWGQVAVKAETVLARHPRSKWTEEARYLVGKARERLGDCAGAIAPLEIVVRGRDPVRADDAALRLSKCKAVLGDVEGAGFAAERLLQSPDPARRAEAGWRTGAAYRRSGRSEEAVRTLQASAHPRARGELAAALADAGRVSEAIALADSLIAARDSTVPWGDVVGAIGQRDTLGGSALLDRLLPAIRQDPDSAATWLSADAQRLLPLDPSRALARYEAAYTAAPARAVGVDARITALRYRLARADGPELLDTVPALLGEVEPSAGEALFRARQLVASAASARARLDSLDPLAPEADIRGLFLGEALRDSLHAPRLAAGVWRRVLAARPESPYAPKLLLALAASDPADADSIGRLLADRYAASPYVLAIHGQDDAGYRALEDSLARFSAQARAPARPPVRGRRPTPAPTGGVVQ
jgi:tetratricopeptide (TPR) repeat protein